MLQCKLHLAEISTDIKLLQTYFDISNTFEASSMFFERSSGASSPKNILEFPVHLIFISRSSSSMVLEPRSGASSLKKQVNLHRWLKKRKISSYGRHIWTCSTHWNFVSRSTSSIVLEPSSGASSLKKQGNLHRWLKNVRYQAIADIF